MGVTRWCAICILGCAGLRKKGASTCWQNLGGQYSYCPVLSFCLLWSAEFSTAADVDRYEKKMDTVHHALSAPSLYLSSFFAYLSTTPLDEVRELVRISHNLLKFRGKINDIIVSLWDSYVWYQYNTSSHRRPISHSPFDPKFLDGRGSTNLGSQSYLSTSSKALGAVN